MKDDIIQFQKQRIEALENELKAYKKKLDNKNSIPSRRLDPVFNQPIQRVDKQYH